MTPQPTISTPLHNLKNSLNDTYEAKSSADELTIDSNYHRTDQVKKVEKTASKQNNEKAEVEPKITKQDSIKQILSAKIVSDEKSEKKDDLSVKSSDKSTKSKSLSVAVSTISQELIKLETLEREKKKLIDSKESNPCGCGQTRIQFSDKIETNVSKVCTNKIEQSNKSIDMKSQMEKYNDYLHYLRFGFPPRKTTNIK